ncbi:MAG: hypothetical protein HC902_02990 [Calothrix sp. SM1_5_4]|nr:hypothetical protein [Calothrix sp. SM1_5_4]
MLEFQSGKMGEALKSFGVVRNRFIKSNKRPAAMFAAAATYQKLGLKPQAERLWREIIKEYPGSSESQRAWMHLRVAKLDSAKRR